MQGGLDDDGQLDSITSTRFEVQYEPGNEARITVGCNTEKGATKLPRIEECRGPERDQ